MATIPIPTLLLVDDNALILSVFQRFCAYTCFSPRIAHHGQEAVQILKSEAVDGMITDLSMPIMDGYALIDFCSKNFPQLPIMVITGEAVDHSHPLLSSPQIAGVHPKPVDFKNIMKVWEQKLSHLTLAKS